MILILFAFLAGIVTILSPCILPILPIVLSGSLSGGKRRPLGVIVGFIISFTFFAIFSFLIADALGFSTEILRLIAVVMLIIFGLMILIPSFQLMFERLSARLSFIGQGTQKTGFTGGFGIGLTLGLIWTPCVGPILASVLTLAATSQITLQLVIITLAYSIGTAIPLFFIAYGGKKALTTLPFLKRNAVKIQKAFGVLIILTALMIYFSIDRKFQTFILQVFPQYGSGLTSFENNQKVQDELKKLKDSDKNLLDMFDKKSPVSNKSFEGATRWLQSEPLDIEKLKGKVVLVDFWTYTCINCIRTFPYVTSWYEKYKDDGFVVIGVHTPEFEFEKSTSNVLDALKQYKITYPVVQDNEYKIWNSYNNQYWPAHYLIDKDGFVRYTHFGEGEYDVTEKMIQSLLRETGKSVETEISEPSGDNPSSNITPETYLGSSRIDRFGSPEQVKPEILTAYSIPQQLPQNYFAYSGNWNIMPEYAESSKDAILELSFEAKEVFLVMKPKNIAKPGTATILLDGKPLPKELSGVDVKNGVAVIDKDRLYRLVRFDEKTSGRVTIIFNDEPVYVFAFTFS